MKNLLEYILIHLVQFPDQVVVEESQVEGVDVYMITVNPEDMGRVIGKEGNVIQAIRTLARVRAMKENRRIRVDLNDQK